MPPPDETLPMVIARVPPDDESGNKRWTINGRSYNPEDSPLPVKEGRRYRLAFDNTSSDAHPLHLHRTSSELTKVNEISTCGLIKDVMVVKPYQNVEVDFVSEEEGLTLFHRHN